MFLLILDVRQKVFISQSICHQVDITWASHLTAAAAAAVAAATAAAAVTAAAAAAVAAAASRL